MRKKPNPELIDEDTPEWTASDFKNAMTFSELPDDLQRILRSVRGPQKAPTKVPATIRFDADVLAALKASGKGWQTRVNEAVKDWLKTHPPTNPPSA